SNLWLLASACAIRVLRRLAVSRTLAELLTNRIFRKLWKSLLDDLQVRALAARTLALVGRAVRAAGRVRWLRMIRAVGKNHALPGLLGINAEYCPDGNPDIEWDTTKAGPKADGIVRQLGIMRRRVTDIEDDLAVLDMLPRHGNAIYRGVDHYVRRVSIVAHPFMHRADEVRTLRAAGNGHAYRPLVLASCPVNNYAISLRLSASGGVATPRNSGAITRRRALPATKTRERNSIVIYG